MESGDEAKISSPNKQEGEVEIPPKIKNRDEQAPPQDKITVAKRPSAEEEDGKPTKREIKNVKETIPQPYAEMFMFENPEIFDFSTK